MKKNPLFDLVDEKISAIVFVQDYLQIQFDGPILTFLAYPNVQANGGDFSFGEVEYRNKICEFIGRTVSKVNYVEDDIFCLLFENDRIYCLINSENYTLPEMIIYNDDTGATVVI